MTKMNMDRFNEKHDAALANSGTDFSNIPRLVVENGQPIRLVGDFSSAWEHFVEFPNGSRPYYCDGPESECPLCEAANRLGYSDDEADQTTASKIRAKEKYYFNCLDRSEAGKKWHERKKVTYVLAQNEKSLNIGTMLFKAIGNIAKMRKQQGRNEDPNTYDIVLTKEGSKLTTKYGAQFSGNEEPLTEDELAYAQHDLSEICRISTPADRKAAAMFILGEAPAPSKAKEKKADEAGDDEVPFDVHPDKPAAKGPVQRIAAGPAPAKPPATKAAQTQAQPVTQVVAPPAATATKEPEKRKLVLPTTKAQYQNTAPLEEKRNDPSHMFFPCPECTKEMMIDMENVIDLKCYSCGKIFDHPSAPS